MPRHTRRGAPWAVWLAAVCGVLLLAAVVTFAGFASAPGSQGEIAKHVQIRSLARDDSGVRFAVSNEGDVTLGDVHAFVYFGTEEEIRTLRRGGGLSPVGHLMPAVVLSSEEYNFSLPPGTSVSMLARDAVAGGLWRIPRDAAGIVVVVQGEDTLLAEADLPPSSQEPTRSGGILPPGAVYQSGGGSDPGV